MTSPAPSQGTGHNAHPTMASDLPSQPPPLIAVRYRPAVILFLSILIGVLIADLLTKSLAFQYVAGQPVLLTPDNIDDPATIPAHEAIPIVPHVLSLKLTLNTGAVFGLGKGQRTAFILISLIAIAVISYVFLKSAARDWVGHIAWALILAGALGNLYDRVFYAAVRDMLWLFPGIKLPFGWRWPSGAGEFAPWTPNTGPDEVYPWIFNIADVALVIGVGFIILLSFRGEEGSRAKRPGPRD